MIDYKISLYAANMLKMLRENNNISQEEIAEYLTSKKREREKELLEQGIIKQIDTKAITRQTVSKYENGERKLNLDHVFDLANYFNVSVNDFFPYKNNNNEYDEQIKKIATKNGVEISYAKEKPITAEDVLDVNKVLMEELSKEKDNDSWIG